MTGLRMRGTGARQLRAILASWWHVILPFTVVTAWLAQRGHSLWWVTVLVPSLLVCLGREWLDRGRRRRSPGGCTRRDCQSCKTGWPVDGEPLSGSETRRWVGIWQAYESDAVAAEPVYPHRKERGR